MPNLNFSDSVYIGTSNGTVGISMDDQTQLISYPGGLINLGGYSYPIRNQGSLAAYTMSSADCIVLISALAVRGAANIIYLGSQSNGKVVYFRRIDANNATTYIIQASGSDVIRLGSTTPVTSFTIGLDQAYSLIYGSGTWWLMRNGGNVVYNPPPPAPAP